MRYHRLSLLSVVLTVVPLFSLATPLAQSWNHTRVKHALKAVPANWESIGVPHPATTMDLYVALKPRNENALINALYEVSTPRHPNYGAHLSKEEAAQLVAPHPHTLELVHSWLAHHGVQPSSISTTHGGSWLTLSGVPVSQANKLLGASYELYRHAETDGATILRTVGYELPTQLHAHIKTVAPTTFFSSTRMLQQKPRRHSVRAAGTPAEAAPAGDFVSALSRRNDYPDDVTPEFLRWLYKTVTYVPVAIDRNWLGVVGHNNEFPSATDLTLFMTVFRTEAMDATFSLELVNDGDYDPHNPGFEANLDMQYAQAMAYPTPHVFYSVGGKSKWSLDTGEPLWGDSDLMWLAHMFNQEDENVPQTVTISYGVNEKDVPREYATAMCPLFAELGVRGVSIIYSSGDDGVGAGNCRVNDGTNNVQFIPKYPASCPWVTTVGGTTSSLPEVAARISGGGFSNYFPRPAYQNETVLAYLRILGTKYEGSYNKSGRGFPDVAAQALNFRIAINGAPHPISGTSCAAPTVAGIISLLNDFLLSSGKPPLGFLNPWLYGGGVAGFTDIVSGSNPGCGTDGFSAVPGWDPVTGLGTPDFSELQDILFHGPLFQTQTSGIPHPTNTPNLLSKSGSIAHKLHKNV